MSPANVSIGFHLSTCYTHGLKRASREGRKDASRHGPRIPRCRSARRCAPATSCSPRPTGRGPSTRPRSCSTRRARSSTTAAGSWGCRSRSRCTGRSASSRRRWPPAAARWTTSSSASAGSPMRATSSPSIEIYRTYFTQGPAGALDLSRPVHVRVQGRDAGHRLPTERRGLTVVHAKVWQVVTFAAEPFRGNPAFVVGLEEDLPPELLRALGTQFSGVTAVLGPDQGEAVRLRFVTAAGPHPGAGHAAAAAAAIVLESRPEVEVSFEDGSRRRFWRDPWAGSSSPGPPCPGPRRMPARRSRPRSATARPVSRCRLRLCRRLCGRGDRARLAPDMAALANLDRNAVIATAPGDAGASDIVIRVFAPKVGLPEDPVCGTAHRIIAPFWSERLGRTNSTAGISRPVAAICGVSSTALRSRLRARRAVSWRGRCVSL